MICYDTEHGGHGHSHGGITHSHTRLTQLVSVGATDDNENDETFCPPLAKEHATNGKVATADQMNMRGVFLHILADALGSVIVIASAMVRDSFSNVKTANFCETKQLNSEHGWFISSSRLPRLFEVKLWGMVEICFRNANCRYLRL